MAEKCPKHDCKLEARIVGFGRLQYFCPKCLEEERRGLHASIRVNLPKHLAMKEFYKRRK